MYYFLLKFKAHELRFMRLTEYLCGSKEKQTQETEKRIILSFAPCMSVWIAKFT